MLRSLIWNKKALISTKTFYLGDTIWYLQGKKFTKPSKNTIEIAPNHHVEDINGTFMNHSCLPNTTIFNGQVIAIRTITKGMELTCNYTKTESQMVKPFLCYKCNHYIDGKKTKCPVYKKSL